ncbi:MAG: efflux RND transporter permease subunit [Azospirillaceae bacterium]|nr:efflux RND transporter permease subunit [Azospirillaceae bacterium]
MTFTDIFIRRKVLACVVSLMILVLGVRALGTLQILEYPKTENAVITVTTTYPGADAETVAGFVTTPLENAVAQANGIDYMSSTSQNNTSTITLNLRLNYDSNRAMTEVNAKINSVLNQLPSGTQQPVMTVKVGQSLDALIIGFASNMLAPNQVTDYLVRTVQPRLQAVEGVQTAELMGSQNFALRAWLDPEKLAAFGVTATDVATALSSNDYIASIGQTKGQMVQATLTASTSLHTVDEFRKLIVKQVNGGIVRLSDVANVTLGADDYESGVSFDGKAGVYIGIQTVPSANLLDVINAVKAALPAVQAQLPGGLTSAIVYDSTDFVNSSIDEVVSTLLEAVAIVTVVVLAFLGTFRSVIIPVVAIPLSLIGTFAMMLVFGFSVNLLTLLALVLAIGLVVDDAIIVVENVTRHLEEGKHATEAAVMAARELASPIIAMTVVLIAVYVPIGFQQGLTGALFTEFAFTLVGAVTVSAIVALTLSPMMCAVMLRPHHSAGGGGAKGYLGWLDRNFERLEQGYVRALRGSLATLPVTLLFMFAVLGSIYFLYSSADTELAPQEDQGVVILQPTASPSATLQQKQLYSHELQKILASQPESEHQFAVDSTTLSIAGAALKPWNQRTRDATTIQRALQDEMNTIAGQKIVVFQPPSLPGSQGLPIQFVLKTTRPVAELYAQSQHFLEEAQKSGLFMFLDSDLKLDLPQYKVVFDRDKLAQLGLSMQDVGGALGNMLGGNYVNYFSLGSRSYKVIPQVQQRSRLTVQQLLDYQVAVVNGVPVPLSAVARVEQQTVPETLNHFQQINAATISGVAAPGVAQGDALAYLKDLAARTLSDDITLDYGGQLRQFIQESGGLLVTFGFALVIIFLALAALFESFRDPLIILISIPMSLAGALLFISIGVHGASLNIYTEVGLVTLMGLISKHGILMVEVANEQQAIGKSKLEAIVEAARIRLRPILMTTAAMVLGVIPLIIASGAGAASRFNMGLVIAAGLSIGTLFTLFVLPGVYVVIAARHRHDAPDLVPRVAPQGAPAE